MAGSISGVRTGKASVGFQSGSSPGDSGCKGRLTWRMHPATRRKVQDGKWRLGFADRESETFTVSDGGRLATGIGFPRELSSCGEFGGVDLFIGPGGTAQYPKGSGLDVVLRFSARSASGSITVPPGNCTKVNFAMTASLLKGSP
ncbi:MAG: hypothetical protein ACYC91_17785 [Solirubrobacteraceae bacterium]